MINNLPSSLSRLHMHNDCACSVKLILKWAYNRNKKHFQVKVRAKKGGGYSFEGGRILSSEYGNTFCTMILGKPFKPSVHIP